MQYALVDSFGNILRRQGFSEEVPQLAEEKGLRWIVDAKPTFDRKTHSCTVITPVIGDTVLYEILPLPPETLNAEINRAIIEEISLIEAKQGRAVREAALGAPEYLMKIQVQIAALQARIVKE